MSYKVMIAGDLHKRMQDKSTIRGYCKACRQVQEDIMKYIKDNGVTHFISLGDWYDRGYGSDVAAALVDTELDMKMAELLHGNFYGLVGNHIRIDMDSSPETFLMQPHDVYKSRRQTNRTEQIIKTPDRFVLNGVEFILMHWNPLAQTAMDYKTEVDPDCHFHVALYHTEQVIPSHLLTSLNLPIHLNDGTTVAEAIKGVDIAIVGHIHKKIGTNKVIGADGRTTTIIIPGSLMNTDSGMKSRHDEVDIPIIEVDDDGNASLSYYTQSLYTDMCQFFEKNEAPKLKSLQGNAQTALYEEYQSTVYSGDNSSFLSFERYMDAAGFRMSDKAIVHSVIINPDDISTLSSLMREEEGDNL